MALVAVTVNEFTYQVACDEGQEEHVAHLAEYLDERVRELVENIGQVGEARLLLMAALQIAYDLAEAHQLAEDLNADLETAQSAGDQPEAKDTEAQIRAERIVAEAADRLESIAAALMSP